MAGALKGSFIQECHNLESQPFATNVNNSQQKIFTNTGYAITKNCINIIKLCSTPINHTLYKWVQIDANSESFVTIGTSNMKPINKNIIITHPYHLLCWKSIHKSSLSFNINIAIVNGTKGVDIDLCLQDDKPYCFIMTPSTFKKRWIQSQLFRSTEFGRIICYQSDMDNQLNKYKMNHRFKWFVWPLVSSLDMHINPTFKDMMESITIVCEEEKSKKEHITYHNIICKKPIESITLDGLVEKTIIDSINSYDIKRVIKHLSSPIIKTERDILKCILKRFNDDIRAMEENELYVNKMEFANSQDKQNRIEDISRKKQDIESKKQELVKRITANNLCFICYSDIEVKCVLKCCANITCFECISKWTHIKNSCPLCKTESAQYFINEDFVEDMSDVKQSNCIFKNFELLIHQLLECKDKSRRILILAKDDMLLNRFIKLIPNYVQSIKFKGNFYMLQKQIEQFDHQGDENKKVLLLNSSKLACGFPIKCATDLISLCSGVNMDNMIHQCENLKHVWLLSL